MKPTNLWHAEPTMVLAVVQAVLAMVVAFGLELSNEQTGSILAVSGAILALITRSQVSPTKTPEA